MTRYNLLFRFQGRTVGAVNSVRKPTAIRFLIQYALTEERRWAWERWTDSREKTLEKWIKKYIKTKFKLNQRSFFIHKTLVLVREIGKTK